MPAPNIFNSELFNLTSLTAAINNLPYQPSLLASLGIFEEGGTTTLDAWVEEQNGILELLEVQPRNAAGKGVGGEKRKGYPFRIPHIPSQATIMADEVQGIRAFGTESALETIQSRRDQRLAIMRRSMDYTIESHRLMAIKGGYMNANNEIASLFDSFGVTQQTHAMALGTDSTKVRTKISEFKRKIEDALGGLPFTGVRVLCGSGFYDKLIEHPDVVQRYIYSQDAAAIRNDPTENFMFGGVTFTRYRGTNAVQIADLEAYAVPVGVAGLFLTRFAPANYMETVNTQGIPYYAKSLPMEFDKGLKMEAQSNPLNICTRPAAVIKLTTN